MQTISLLRPGRTSILAATLCGLIIVAGISCSTPPTPPPVQVAPNPTATNPPTNAAPAEASTRVNTNNVIARIREEGMERSQAMDTLSYLSDVIGPRLTASPAMKRANEWTRAKMEAYGLTNAHLEAWGPFGHGWTLKRFSAQVIEPHTIPIKAYPNAWSPGLNRAIDGPVVYFDASSTNDLDKYVGKLKGAIILASPVRAVPPRFEPLARRYDATNLLTLANANPPGTGAPSFTPRPNPTPNDNSTNAPARDRGTNAPPRRGGGGGFGQNWTRFLPFLIKEGAAVVMIPSATGDAGTIFVAGASVPQPTNNATGGATNAPARLNAYSTNAPKTLPQITVAVEDYNRLVRMIKLGEKLTMNVELEVEFQTKDTMSYNTIAEIPGSDLKDQIVMGGAHLDTWHAGTGATDNGVGCVAMMEAARILKALNLQPRRTIRIGLWSGEEQGLHGSRAYVTNHFGRYRTNTLEAASNSSTNAPARGTRARGNRELVKEPAYENFSAYFNLDNGAGKIRGVYMQGNEGVRPYFRKWLDPFRDLGAETLTPSNTGGTDHLSFDNIGLPGFQFIQDPLDYSTRTHHSNEDVFDRIQPDDLKQAATVIAAFLYQAAMLDEKLPRKPTE